VSEVGFKDAYSQLVSAIYDHDKESDIGLEYGEYLKPHALCDFSRALMTAQDFKAAMQLIDSLHYMQGASYYVNLNLSTENPSASLCYPFKQAVSSRQKRFCAEAVFSYILNLTRDSLGQDNNPTEIYLDFARPEYSEKYEARFKCPIYYNSPLAMIKLDSELLEQPLVTSNSTLHQLYLNKCHGHIRRADKTLNIDYRVMAQLMRHHPSTFSGAELARRMNISARGLQKKLCKQDCSFSSLSTLARRELAKVYLLQKQTSIETVCERLGFQTISGFRRFIKNEFKQTLAEFLSMHGPANTNHERLSETAQTINA
jgi:AraC-like DNA-binding protein